MSARQLESIATRIAAMDRPQLIESLRGVKCSFDLDFTDEFLRSVSVERLRHILMAAALHESRLQV